MQLVIPTLNEGETFIGAITNAEGVTTATILLPGDNDDAPWQAQMDWAKSIGGDLPNRIEQAMLFAHFKDQFKPDWYWSNETHASDASYAWYQGITYGTQGTSHKNDELRARAVRRLIIE